APRLFGSQLREDGVVRYQRRIRFYAAQIKATLVATAINVRKGVIRHERKAREGGHQPATRTGRHVRNGGRKAATSRERNTGQSQARLECSHFLVGECAAACL